MVTTRRRRWWKDRFFTLMVIPERTKRAYKLIIPSFVIKVGFVGIGLCFLLLAVMALDYVQVLGNMSENKRLKGENFKLRQEIQLIRNKVDSMQWTIERVRSYAKKMQLLTGESDKSEIPWGPTELEDEGSAKLEKSSDRHPASIRDSRYTPLERDSDFSPVAPGVSLGERVDKLSVVTQATEATLVGLQGFLMNKRAIIRATPSLLPISGWISSSFGYRNHPLEGGYRLHAGVDIVADPGTPVRSPADGMVIFSGNKEGYGKVVVLDHGYSISTLFAHNSKLFVTAGSRVKRGEVISQVGSTGMSTGPHLHYEIRKNGIPINPVAFISRNRF